MNNKIKLSLCLLCLFTTSSCFGNNSNQDKDSIPNSVSQIIKDESPNLDSEESISYSEGENSMESEISYIENDIEEIPIDHPYITCDRVKYSKNDNINVKLTNTNSGDWVGIYAEGTEPGYGYSIVWRNATQETLSFQVSTLNGTGFYNVFLCDDGGYNVLDVKSIKVVDDDSTNYTAKAVSSKIVENNGAKKVVLTITPSSDKLLTYSLYWSNDIERLDGYTPLKKFTKKASEPFDVELNECLIMPDDADSIEVSVSEGRSYSIYTKIDEGLKRKKSNYRFSFEALSDLHIESFEDTNTVAHVSHLRNALKDINSVAYNSKGIFSIGDQANHGYQENYDCLLKIFEEEMANSNIPVYFALGNHEYNYMNEYLGGNATERECYQAAMDFYTKNTGNESPYYSVVIDNYKFIVLCSDTAIEPGNMNEEHLNWLKNELASTSKDMPTFLFLHQPLKNTVSGSFENQGWYGMKTDGDKIRSILSEYPNTFFFTGHTHWTLDSVQPMLFGRGENSYIC